LAEIEQAEIPVAFDELARRFAAMRDTLQEQRNDDPEIATLKKQANAALAVLISTRPRVYWTRSGRGGEHCRRTPHLLF